MRSGLDCLEGYPSRPYSAAMNAIPDRPGPTDDPDARPELPAWHWMAFGWCWGFACAAVAAYLIAPWDCAIPW